MKGKTHVALLLFTALLLGSCSNPGTPQPSASGTWIDPVAKVRPQSGLSCYVDPMRTLRMVFTLSQSGTDVSGTVRLEDPSGQDPPAFGQVSAQLQSGELRGYMTFYPSSGTPIAVGFEARVYTSAIAGQTVSPLLAVCPTNGQMVEAYITFDARKQ